jgi:ribosomal protein L11 methyltransferase
VSWLQLRLQVTPDALDDVEQVFFSCGAVAITLLSDANEPVLEPDPGETPLWSSVWIQGLFPIDTDIHALRSGLEGLSIVLEGAPDVDFVGAQNWQQAVRTYAVDRVFGERLWLLPKDQAVTIAKPNLVQLRLDPGLAFGSGSHPTTSLCLQWLADSIKPDMKVLDFGCGSGVLGIGAALLGASVTAVDHDRQAVLATSENAAYNGLGRDRVNVMALDQWQPEQYLQHFDVVVANILAAPLQALAPDFERVLKARGAIVLSGILSDQADEVMASYAQTDFSSPEFEAGWARLQGYGRGR